MDDSEKDEIITIHIDTPEGKTVSKIDVPLSELVECYMNVHFPLQNHKYDNDMLTGKNYCDETILR